MVSQKFGQGCLFETDRLAVLNWDFIASKKTPIESVLKIMTPNVTKSLPDGWQNIDTLGKAGNWINERKADRNFFAVSLTETNEIIGFLFLHHGEEKKESGALRLGYLLAERFWGKGIGSELISGLVKWCWESGIITSISGGVEKDNMASIKVLEKNGFHKSDEGLPGDMLLYKIDLNAKRTK